jgi:hypothetical protein
MPKKSEATRQCEMAWKRGLQCGLTIGIIGTLIVAGIIKLFF